MPGQADSIESIKKAVTEVHEDDEIEVDDEDEIDDEDSFYLNPATAITTGSKSVDMTSPVKPTTGLDPASSAKGAIKLKKLAKAAKGTVGGAVSVADKVAVGASSLSPAISAAAPVLGPVGIGLSLASSAQSLVASTKSYRHVAELEEILKKYGNTAKGGTEEAIKYAIVKKNLKMCRHGFGVVPIVGRLAINAYGFGKAIQKTVKKTRGVNRRLHADKLWRNQMGGDICARKACEELLGSKSFNEIKDSIGGVEILMLKLKSI